MAIARFGHVAIPQFWRATSSPLRGVNDPDARAGICCEIRLQLHAGSPAVPESPQRARCILAICHSHYTSRDPGRKTKDDPKGRGWFSNMGAIMMVKDKLGMVADIEPIESILDHGTSADR